MRLAVVSLALLALSTLAFGQLRPATVVDQADRSFPLVADLNGDGLDDMVMGRQAFLNLGTSFSRYDLGLAGEDQVIGVLDVNGDGIPDFLTDDQNGHMRAHNYRLYVADSSRHYRSVSLLNQSTLPPPAAADVNGDGKDDLIVQVPVFNVSGVGVDSTDLVVYLSRGDGTFDVLPQFRIPEWPIVRDARLEAGDVDHDGIPDLVLRTIDNFVFLHGTGGGKFTVETRYAPPGPWGTWDFHVADVDGDGNLDLVFPGVRQVRVLFGDGHWNFPRSAAAAVTKQHGATNAPPVIANIPPDNQEPRTLALGHFTRKEGTQIAGGTSEGDIVVFGYENGALTEVARTVTDFWLVDVRAGNFHGNGVTDVYGSPCSDFSQSGAQPRIYYGSAGSGTGSRAPVRRRPAAAQPRSSDIVMNLHVEDGCGNDITRRLVMRRDGAYGRAGDGTEAVFDDGKIYLRMNVPGMNEGWAMTPTLLPWEGAYVAEFFETNFTSPTKATMAYWKVTVE